MNGLASHQFRMRFIAAIMGAALAMYGVSCNDNSQPDPSRPAGQSDVGLTVFAGWSESEISVLSSLWIGRLEAPSPDPSNAFGDYPQAASLGWRLFFDPRLSANGQVSCATCHQPERLFTDGLERAVAIGMTDRNTPSIVGTAYNPWFFWDGRRDSQWSQAMVPLEASAEHGGSRTLFAHIIANDEEYREAYEQLFGQLPDLNDRSRFPDFAGPVDDPDAAAAWASMSPRDRDSVTQIFVNLSKSIAAYERQIIPGFSPFDDYVSALLSRDEEAMAAALTSEEIAGLRLFITSGNCVQCHNGPLLTNGGFHSVGVPDTGDLSPDVGRFRGVKEAVENEFNCLGDFSDADEGQCQELRFVKSEGLELIGAFKVPSLRNVAETAPYMHAGQFPTLAEVLDHYNQAPPGPAGHSDLQPLGLSADELSKLEAFLRKLSGPLDVPAELLSPP